MYLLLLNFSMGYSIIQINLFYKIALSFLQRFTHKKFFFCSIFGCTIFAVVKYVHLSYLILSKRKNVLKIHIKEDINIEKSQ